MYSPSGPTPEPTLAHTPPVSFSTRANSTSRAFSHAATPSIFLPVYSNGSILTPIMRRPPSTVFIMTPKAKRASCSNLGRVLSGGAVYCPPSSGAQTRPSFLGNDHWCLLMGPRTALACFSSHHPIASKSKPEVAPRPRLTRIVRPSCSLYCLDCARRAIAHALSTSFLPVFFVAVLVRIPCTCESMFLRTVSLPTGGRP
mmetsp:Transcript_22266/g.60094  ORF Transcript_22266/g.60094 Transcript_22266/m.60094 type:complete len:200 (+) Transcript_22266:278-877(+)